MKAIRLFSLELGRLLRSRLTWLVILLTAVSPAAGLILYQPAYSDTMLSLYLANPALAGGVGGGILFALLTIFELDRTGRSRVDMLMDAAVSPHTMAWVRLLALLAGAVLATVLTIAVWFPISLGLIGSVFTGTDYVLSYLLFLGLALPLSILAAASAYQITRRADLSLVLFAAFAGLSLTVWADQWQLCWLNPSVWAMSDDFTNFRLFRSVAYVRLTWLGLLSGVWAVSYLCIRRYGKGLLGSLARGLRQLYRPAIALVLLACSGTAYAAQPFYDNSNPDLNAMELYNLDYAEGVTFLDRTVQVFPDTQAGTVEGRAVYRFQNASGQGWTVYFGVDPGYDLTATVDGEAVPAVRTGYEESNMALWEITLPAGEQVELALEYGGFPKDWNLSSTSQGKPEISETYLCLENQRLFPYLLNVLPGDEGYPTTVEITLPASMTAIPFGTSEAEVIAEHGDSTKTWRYTHNRTGGILYAGDYIREDIQAGGITVAFYYGRKHQAVMEAAGAADAVKAVISYCTQHYGFPSAFGATGTLKLIQSRVAGGGYAGEGASLLDEADFTTANLGNTSKGAVPGETFIHELVHQWWGLGNMFDVTDETSPWSSEGLTVYTTYRIVKDLYGEDYAQKHYVEQWQQEVDDYFLNFYVRHPEYLEKLPEEERLNIAGSLSGVRHYSEMPLKILKAEQLVGGEEAMDQILHDLFNREIDYTYPYLTYQDFLNACGLTEEELDLG